MRRCGAQRCIRRSYRVADEMDNCEFSYSSCIRGITDCFRIGYALDVGRWTGLCKYVRYTYKAAGWFEGPFLIFSFMFMRLPAFIIEYTSASF